MKKYLEDRGIYITYSQLVMRIIFDLVGFLLALLPAGLTLYLTDVWITSGTHMQTSWILGIIVCVFLIHFYQFYFVNYNSQMNADRMAGNYRQHLAQKILSSSIPAYESQNKARIQNMANDVSAIYTVSSYLVTVPANLVKVIIIIGLLLFYASPSVALTAIILIPLYMVPSFLNKSELERLVAKEREAGDLWFQEFDVILNGKVSITLNKVENYMQNRYHEALKSYPDHQGQACRPHGRPLPCGEDVRRVGRHPALVSGRAAPAGAEQLPLHGQRTSRRQRGHHQAQQQQCHRLHGVRGLLPLQGGLLHQLQGVLRHL